MSTSAESDRRRELRHIASFPTEVQRHTGSSELTLIRDLSTTGALLFTSSKFKMGESLSIELHLGDDSARVVTVEGTVIRCATRPKDHGLWKYSVALAFQTPLDAWRTEVEAVSRTLPPLPVGDA